jgi:hypothetical protein
VTEWLRAVPGAGPLVAAAERFASGADVPRGAAGLAWLARTIDLYADRDAGGDAQEEARFVEGAGALLALVLLDHLGDGAHVARDGVHRIRVGPRGSFDPFAAIERALEESPARAILIDEVARAEREASGRDGIGLAMTIFERVLSEKRPELEIRDRFERRIWIGDDTEIDLGRAIDASGGQGERALEQAMAKLVSMLPGGEGAELDRDEALERMLPRIVAPSLFAAEGGDLFLRPLAGGIASIALVVAYQGRSRFLRTRELDGWGLGGEDAIRHAIARLAARSGRAKITPLPSEHGSMIALRSGDGLDSARLLLPGLHALLATELGSPFVVAIPHRDVLLGSAAHPDALRRELAERAETDARRAPHAITSSLFSISERGVAPLG